jgi:hypothetical protein
MKLRPFFSYYGSKYRIADKYPHPQFDSIIEPFAGSASYSCAHWEHDVMLIDIDPVITGVWNFLISSSESDILSLPIEITDLRKMDLPLAAKHLIGFWLVRCGSSPANVPHSWMRSGLHPQSFWSIEKRKRISVQVAFIKHWSVVTSSFLDVPDAKASWFIDPPYEGPGNRYKFHTIDYATLGVWCKSRDGQVIVTEQQGATWLPFSYFDKTRSPNVRGNRGSRESIEVVWHRKPTPDVK